MPRAAHIRHEVPVALLVKHRGKHQLVPKAQAPAGVKPFALRQPGDRSIMEAAQALEQLRRGGKAKTLSELARQVGLSRHRVRQLLQLTRLAPEVQEYLIKTKDADGKIAQKTLHRLAQVGDHQEQTGRFREMVGALQRDRRSSA